MNCDYPYNCVTHVTVVTCCACILSGLICLNSQGQVCQRFLLHLYNTVDNLEFISLQWRRDYLSAIRLLGNLFQTTLTRDDFPSPNSPLLSF